MLTTLLIPNEEGSATTAKKCLSLRVLITVFLNERINCELRIGAKACSFVVIYKSPSQSQDIFEIFCENFERN